jgi:AraC-like DNA-binding protein
MNALVYAPDGELGTAIDHIWYDEEPAIDIAMCTIPFLHQELLVNFGDHFSVQQGNGAPFLINATGSMTGLLTLPIVTRAKGHYKAMGILFKPFGLYRLFGFSAVHLMSGPLPLQMLLSKDWAALLKAIAVVKDGTEKLRLLENYLLQKARPAIIKEEVTDFLTMLTDEPLRKGHLDRYLKRIDRRPKSFIASFVAVLGYTPQRYMRLVQINKALAMISGEPGASLSSVAYDTGFYDQSHFIRTFRAFAGMSPLAYKKAVLQKRVSPFLPNTFTV